MSEQTPEVRHRTVMDDEVRHVARVYAEALYNAAEKDGIVETVREELETLTDGVFRQNPGLAMFLGSAAISREHKGDVLRKTFSDRASPNFVRFLTVLNEHDRLGMLEAIGHAFRTLYNQKTKRVVVHVRSAVPLNDDDRRRLTDDIRAVADIHPIFEETVDPEILGGLIIRIHDWIYDASVRTRIQAVRHQLIERSSHGIQSGRDRFSS